MDKERILDKELIQIAQIVLRLEKKSKFFLDAVTNFKSEEIRKECKTFLVVTTDGVIDEFFAFAKDKFKLTGDNKRKVLDQYITNLKNVSAMSDIGMWLLERLHASIEVYKKRMCELEKNNPIINKLLESATKSKKNFKIGQEISVWGQTPTYELIFFTADEVVLQNKKTNDIIKEKHDNVFITEDVINQIEGMIDARNLTNNL